MDHSLRRFGTLHRVVLRLTLPLVGACAAWGLSACHPHAELSKGRVPAARSASTPPLAGRIEISEKGFVPSRVIVENAQPLVFRRTTDAGCATAVIFPQFRIEEPLPINTDVSIVLPPTASGEVAFQCGVGENRGKVVATVAGS